MLQRWLVVRSGTLVFTYDPSAGAAYRKDWSEAAEGKKCLPRSETGLSSETGSAVGVEHLKTFESIVSSRSHLGEAQTSGTSQCSARGAIWMHTMVLTILRRQHMMITEDLRSG